MYPRDSDSKRLSSAADKIDRVPPGHGKSWKVMEFSKTIFQAWEVMENSKGRGKSWKMMIMSCNFYNCTEQFCKSDTNCEP